MFGESVFVFLAEIEKCEGDDLKKDGDMKKYLDIISNKNIKLSERVLIPVQQYPKVGSAATGSSETPRPAWFVLKRASDYMKI